MSSSSSPRQMPLHTNESSVGCLLVMDDNHRLVEWLAYHHFTMNLRYLVVAVDPRSSTSPEAILQRWKPYGLEYQIWKDEDYMGARVLDKRQRLFELGRKHLTQVHRVRQKAFYQYCLEHLDKKGYRQWTLLLDVDEYLVLIHHQDDKEEDDEENVRHKSVMSTPGGLYNFIRQTEREAQQPANSNNPHYEQFASPCVSLPRLLFGTVTTTTSTTTSSNSTRHDTTTTTTTTTTTHPQSPLPLSINDPLERLDTMRWFYHAPATEMERNGNAKTILNLQRIRIPNHIFPIPSIPIDPWPISVGIPNALLTLIRAHWYECIITLVLGKTYSFRNDSRKGGERSREAWEFRALYDQHGPNWDIVPWWSGFVQVHGVPLALALLHDAGLPETYTHAPQVNEQWKYLFVQDTLGHDNDKKKKTTGKEQKQSKQRDSRFAQFLQNRTAQQQQQQQHTTIINEMN